MPATMYNLHTYGSNSIHQLSRENNEKKVSTQIDLSSKVRANNVENAPPPNDVRQFISALLESLRRFVRPKCNKKNAIFCCLLRAHMPFRSVN